MKKKLSKMRRKNNKIYSSASKSAIREEQEFLESEEKILKQNILSVGSMGFASVC